MIGDDCLQFLVGTSTTPGLLESLRAQDLELAQLEGHVCYVSHDDGIPGMSSTEGVARTQTQLVNAAGLFYAKPLQEQADTMQPRNTIHVPEKTKERLS